MNTIYMNSKNSQISDPHRLLLNLTENMFLYQILAYAMHGKI